MYEGRKADAMHPAEGSSPRYAIGDVPRTPPGSETRACTHGGSLGTWEVQMLPWVRGWYKEIQRKAKSTALPFVLSSPRLLFGFSLKSESLYFPYFS